MSESTSSAANSTLSVAFCGQCGHKNAAGFNFCQQCGESGVTGASAQSQYVEAGAEPSMTLLKATGIYAIAIGLHIAAFRIAPAGVAPLYLATGFVMTRIVMRGLIEWHPNYNTLDNVVGAKMKMFALWPIQMASLLVKLAFNKLM